MMSVSSLVFVETVARNDYCVGGGSLNVAQITFSVRFSLDYVVFLW